MHTKTDENRVRREADRQGYLLRRYHGRDPNHPLYGTYMLVDASTNGIVIADRALQWGYGLDLDDIADWLAEE